MDCGEAGWRQRGHSGFVWHHPTMHSQQNRWPQGVAAPFCRGDMHREHRRRERGNSATSAGVFSGVTAGTRDDACVCATVNRVFKSLSGSIGGGEGGGGGVAGLD